MMDELGVFPHNASNCSIVAVGDTLFVCTSNGQDWTHVNIPSPLSPSFIALNKKTGELLGEDDAEIGPRILHGQWTSPSVGTVNGKTQVISAVATACSTPSTPRPLARFPRGSRAMRHVHPVPRHDAIRWLGHAISVIGLLALLTLPLAGTGSGAPFHRQLAGIGQLEKALPAELRTGRTNIASTDRASGPPAPTPDPAQFAAPPGGPFERFLAQYPARHGRRARAFPPADRPGASGHDLNPRPPPRAAPQTSDQSETHHVEQYRPSRPVC